MFLKTEERPAGEVQQAGRLRLSEAIRIGAKIRPQCKSFLFFAGKSCALGAAYEAFFGHPGADGYWSDKDLRFMESFGTKLRGKYPALPFVEIVSRNDRGESRESIADWLQSQGL
jgi:hypothetical protein